jgi:hypothetical protein
MALVHNSVTLAAATATIIATIPAGNPLTAVHVSNLDSAAIFVGDSSLSNTGVDKGARIAASASHDFWLNAGDSLYAYSVAGTAANTVTVLFSTVTR